jgi:hypothetical protein
MNYEPSEARQVIQKISIQMTNFERANIAVGAGAS